MAVFQLIYTSQPFGFDDAMLGAILVTSRRNNPKWGITGCLICRHDIYLQLLEGDEAQVEALFGRIARDDRHLAVTRLSGESVDARMFPDWAMRDDPAKSWIWTAEEVGKGAVTAASVGNLRAVFAQIAQ